MSEKKMPDSVLLENCTFTLSGVPIVRRLRNCLILFFGGTLDKISNRYTRSVVEDMFVALNTPIEDQST